MYWPIENTIPVLHFLYTNYLGKLKNYFFFNSCLLKHRVLHYSPVTASKIVNACVVLHNMCIENNEVLHTEDHIDFADFGVFEPIRHENNENITDLTAGRRVQRTIIRHFI